MLSSSPITLSSLAIAPEEESQEIGGKVKLPSEPISPQYVIPITPTLIPSFTSYGTTSHEANFDHNDIKYQCCYGYMHITVSLNFAFKLKLSMIGNN